MAAARVISLPRGGRAKDSSGDTRLMSDENLVAVAKNGKRTAFDELHNRHVGKMFHVAHRITGNREDAEDVVQECFLKAFIHLNRFDGRSKFSTWLTRIAINTALMKLRKSRTSREIPINDPAEAAHFRIEDALADSLPNPEERFARMERETILRNAIAKLRPPIRKVIEVYQLQECSLSETAEILRISVGAVKARMFHARATLRRGRVLARKASKYPWVDSDACAIDIMNRDEAQFRFSPISFFSAFMVTSTQAIFEKILPAQGPATHPAPKERLISAYQADLSFIQQSPDMARYKATLDGIYEHFGSLIPK